MKKISIFLLGLGFSLSSWAKPIPMEDFLYGFDERFPTFFSYHPMSPITLGQGFDPDELEEKKTHCFQYALHKRPEGASDTQFREYVVLKTSSMRDVLDIDLNIEASYLIYSGSVGFQYNTERIEKANSVTLVLQAKSVYGSWDAENIQLFPFAEKLLEQGESDFKKICGSHYAVTQIRGASVSAIITIDGVSSDFKRTISSTVNAAGGFGPVSGKIRSKMKSEMSRAFTEDRIDVQIVSNGGVGLGGLGDMVRNLTGGYDQFGKIAEALGNYVAGFNAENAAPVGHQIAEIPQLRLINPAWSIGKRDALLKLVDEYRELGRVIETVRAVSRFSDPRRSYFTEDDLDLAREELPRVQDRVDLVFQTHEACKSSVQTDLTPCRIPEFKIPINVDFILRMLRIRDGLGN